MYNIIFFLATCCVVLCCVLHRHGAKERMRKGGRDLNSRVQRSKALPPDQQEVERTQKTKGTGKQ